MYFTNTELLLVTHFFIRSSLLRARICMRYIAPIFPMGWADPVACATYANQVNSNAFEYDTLQEHPWVYNKYAVH